MFEPIRKMLTAIHHGCSYIRASLLRASLPRVSLHGYAMERSIHYGQISNERITTITIFNNVKGNKMSRIQNHTAPAAKLSVLALALFQITNSYAQPLPAPEDSDMPSVTLPTITVYASPASGISSALNDEELQRGQAATSDTTTILSKMSGINTQSGGGISGLPVIRGLADNRLRILADGVDAIASCPNSMNAPLSYIAPSTIENATVYKGVTPVSVGGNSIGGSVVVETADPVFSDDAQVISTGEVGAFYRSNGNGYGANLTSTVANDTFSLTYRGSIAESDNYKAGGDFKSYSETGHDGKTLAKDEVGSSAFKSRNQSIDVAYQKDNHLLQGTYLWQRIPEEGYPNQRMDMLDNQLDRLNLRYETALSWGDLEAQMYHDRVEHYMNFGDDKQFQYGNAAGMPMSTDSETVGMKLKGSIAIDTTNTLDVGAEYQDFQLDDMWAASGTGMMAPNTFQNINNGQSRRTSLYSDWTNIWSPQWRTQLGARYENVRTSADKVHGYQIGGQNNMSNQLRDAAAFNASDRQTTDHNLDVSAIARYQLNDQSSMTLGAAHKARTPSLYERYTWSTWSMAAIMNNTVGDGNGYFGNPELRPEKSNTLSATVNWRSTDDRWQIEATPYYSDINDYVDAVQWNSMMNMPARTQTDNQYNVLRYTNQDARIYGIDMSAQHDLGSNQWGDWQLKGSLSYTKGKNKDSDADLYNIMPLNARLALQNDYRGWRNEVEVIGVAAKTHVSEPRNELKTAGYGLLNLSTSYEWDRVSIEAGVENVLDKQHDLPLGGSYMGQGKTMAKNKEINGQTNWGTAVPGAGRSVYVGVNYKF